MRIQKSIFGILAAVAVLLPSVSAPAQDGDGSLLQFDVTEWNFGSIREEGGRVSHTFRFVNSGADPIAIDRVNVSCGCTTPLFPHTPIQPGQSAEVQVDFDPMGYPGDFSKSVVVVSGGGKYRNMLVISGRVTPRVKGVEEEYPIEMGGGLRIDNSVLPFRQIAQAGSSSMVVRYVNTSTNSVLLEIIPSEASGLINIHAPERVCPGCRGDITLTYDLTDKTDRYGMIHDVLRVTVDGQLSAKTIYTSMIGVDDFSGQSIEIAPRAVLSEQSHNYGEVRRRSMPHVQRLTITNEGEEMLYIRSVTSKPGVKTTLRDGMRIAPGASLPFELLLYSDKYRQGELQESLIMATNDPLRPVREIRIAAKIK